MRCCPRGRRRSAYGGDCVGLDREGIERRLSETGRLEIERYGPHELSVRLGPRFTETET
jgi:hypothetical protein